MPTVVLTATGAGTWAVPGDCPAGTPVNVETWAAGSGGSGTGSTDGGGGGAGAWANSLYTITPNDVASGISNTIGVGGAGNTGVGSVGGDTSFSTNNLNLIPNTTMQGAIVGTTTLPTGWILYGAGLSSWASSGLTGTVVGAGTTFDGFSFIDIHFLGTSATTAIAVSFANAAGVAPIPCTAGLTYTVSFYTAFVAGTTTNVGGAQVAFNDYSAGPAYIGGMYVGFTFTSTMTRNSSAQATDTGATIIEPMFLIAITNASAIDITIRFAGVQIEQAASATFWKSTPGYTLAKGGAAPITTAGGVGGLASASVGTTAKFSGGSGRAFNASGSPGGGAAGKDGAGVTASTTTSGAGDNSLGGAGVAVSAGTANAGTANVEGGSGGGAVTGAGGTGGVGGAPGGGGGGSDGSSGTRTGGAGARGQIRLTYTGIIPTWRPPPPLQLWNP